MPFYWAMMLLEGRVDFMRDLQRPIGGQLLFHSIDWYQSPGAVVTKYHKSYGLKQQKFSHHAGSTSPKWRCQQGWFLLKALRKSLLWVLLLACGGPRHFLAFRWITPILHLHVTSFLCVCVFLCGRHWGWVRPPPPQSSMTSS